jgi:hypothetical protein
VPATLEHTRALIVVFAMPGCPACEEYVPRLERQVTGFKNLGHPILFHDAGGEIAPRTIPILVYDTTSKDAELVALCDIHKITNLPTTLLMTRQGVSRIEGGLNDQQIYEMLSAAVSANR